MERRPSSPSNAFPLGRQVVFTDPYMDAPVNRWTSPELDDTVMSIRGDLKLRINASRLKEKFMQSAEVTQGISQSVDFPFLPLPTVGGSTIESAYPQCLV